MPQRAFYNINPKAYLFPDVVGLAVDKGPEETVRQWCAFELIRAYGYRITNIDFEYPVKVGSKTYRIDILVRRDSTPWIVLECKEPGFTNHSSGIEQAISYAASKQIQAEFAAYTNGSTWLVQRNVHGAWVPIIDLPRESAAESATGVSEILQTSHELGRLLYKLDEPIEGADAQYFLDSMQEFFSRKNILTHEVADEILHATDNLLRVLSVEGAHLDYQVMKVKIAHSHWESFATSRGASANITEVDEGNSLRLSLFRLRCSLLELIEEQPKPFSPDILLLRLNIALLTYGEAAVSGKNQFPPIIPPVHHALRDYLDFALLVHFNTRLPSSVDTGAMEDLKGNCCTSWRDRD